MAGVEKELLLRGHTSHPLLAGDDGAGLQVAENRGHIEKGGERCVALGDVGDCLGGKRMDEEKQTTKEARPEKVITLRG